MRILIGADIVPTDNNIKMFSSGDINSLIGKKLIEILAGADLTVFNLEAPLTDKDSPIPKNGPSLRAPISTITGLTCINPGFFTLANNHILDHGEQGLTSTIELLKKNGNTYAGAGRNIYEASQPYIKEYDGIKIGIYCCAEHEFSIATASAPGANPFDPLESLDHIQALKSKCDRVIVLYHGGKEQYRYPSPYLRKVCRKMVEKGADLVVCQHSHCIGCRENWENGEIVYGQGNFLFDLVDNEFWASSLLLEVSVTKDDMEVSYIPLSKKKNVVRLADRETAKIILDSFYSRSEKIADDIFVRQQYNSFAKENMWVYYKAFAGGFLNNPIYRLINKLLKYRLHKTIPARRYSVGDRIVLKNYIECEAHRELILEGLDLHCNE